ncbi:MAG: cob(I)yrinic acid a,c-diamide adenosyltransferase [Chitinispirillales bacterium]|jgi:cob(I)alamin adenosyltransferase|nr:cob(I)yrinic acid a,c-diamide adenosyltransferase [Chitinispirillales bacterium]
MLQVYTGNGKGKTTAALGLTLRAAGAGLKVFFCQFMKNIETSESKTLKLLGENVVFKQFGSGSYIIDTPTEKDFECALAGFTEINHAAQSGQFDMVIADEICTALRYKLLCIKNVMKFVRNCPKQTELVFTGRCACDILIKTADLVTEMIEIKHFFSDGVSARRGIEF